MQSCVECGWDTRSGSRLCSACRVARGGDAEPESTAAPAANEKEQLLTAVLRSARSPASAQPQGEDEPAGTGTARPQRSEHIVLRELGPGGEGEPAVRGPDRDGVTARHELGTGDPTVARPPAEPIEPVGWVPDDEPPVPPADAVNHRPPVTFDGATHRDTGDDTFPPATRRDDTSPPATRPDDTSPPPTRRDDTSPPATRRDDTSPPATRRDDTSPPATRRDDTIPPATRRNDTGDDVAAILDGPGAWGDEDEQSSTPPQARDRARPVVNGRPTTGDLREIFNTPSPWDDAVGDDPSTPPPTRDPAPEAQTSGPPGGTADDLAALFNTPSPWDDSRSEHDTADDLAALFNRPGPWDRTPVSELEGTGTPDVADRHDTSPPPSRDLRDDDMADVFGSPGGWDQDTQPPPGDDWTGEQLGFDDTGAGRHLPERAPSGPGRHDDIFDAGSGFDSYVDDGVDASAAPVEHGTGDAWGEPGNRNAKYSPDEWPWVSKTGDGGFWAPPRGGEQAARSGPGHQRQDTPALDHATGIAHDDADSGQISGPVSGPFRAVGGAPESADMDSAAAAPQRRATAAPRTAEPERPGGAVGRWFRDLGGWTAIAQVALLAVGMLCIIQVFVLVVVTSYLSDGGAPGGDAAGSLAAHAKVDGVMLPALLGFAVIALAFGAWRGFDAHSGERFLRRPLGIPAGLWAVFAAALLLLAVIIGFGEPADVTEAQRVTQLAMAACILLGITCFIAPRGLEEPVDD